MVGQEKFDSVLELLKHLKESRNNRAKKLEEELKKRKKHMKDSRLQNLPEQYQRQCDNTVRFIEGMLAETSKELKLVKQAIANYRK